MSVTDRTSLHALLRDRLLRAAGVVRPEPVTLEQVRASQALGDFIDLMANRRIIGYFRYGDLSRQPRGLYDRVGSIRKRLDAYDRDGNLEHLVDIANLAGIEYLKSDHPSRHFRAVDDGEHADRVR